MKYLDEFRDPQLARRLIDDIQERATRRWKIMDVCGGQTHSLLKYGIESTLENCVELIHGPGCPVCVTAPETIEYAKHLALLPNVIIATFGDMLRVPGFSASEVSQANPPLTSSVCPGSLADARTRGGQIQIVYSPLDAVELATQNPKKQIVFLAVGFETTVPATALAALQAEQLRLRNFSLLVAHVCVLPVMQVLVGDPNCELNAFLAAGHVCAVSGHDIYRALVSESGLPVIVTGFEPLDLLAGIRCAVELLESNNPQVVNCYSRSVSSQGNRFAQDVMATVYKQVDRKWRGFGTIRGGGLALRERFAEMDAEKRFGTILQIPIVHQETCRSGDVMAGRIKPHECEHFGRGCTPDQPLGAPMVSNEGACSAYYRYAPQTKRN
ncbi:MAG: hydrogenase formation protein HypD [Planctomycetales bacterium]|nr:hydrogenase formation protein HypD [Planctomycetales bacterium]